MGVGQVGGQHMQRHLLPAEHQLLLLHGLAASGAAAELPWLRSRAAACRISSPQTLPLEFQAAAAGSQPQEAEAYDVHCSL